MELEKVAAERKQLEHARVPQQAPHPGYRAINSESIREFSQAFAGWLNTMEVDERHKVLSLLGLEGTVSPEGHIEASIAIPTGSDLTHH